MNKPQKRSIFIITVLLILSVTAFLIKDFISEKGSSAIVTRAGETVCVLKLSKDTEYTLGTNTVTVEDGKVHMSYADCPDKICVAHKPIEKKGETIICMPNRIIIEIE